MVNVADTGRLESRVLSTEVGQCLERREWSKREESTPEGPMHGVGRATKDQCGWRAKSRVETRLQSRPVWTKQPFFNHTLSVFVGPGPQTAVE